MSASFGRLGLSPTSSARTPSTAVRSFASFFVRSTAERCHFSSPSWSCATRIRSLVYAHHQRSMSSLALRVTGCAFLMSSAGPTHTLTTLPTAASQPIRWPSGLIWTCDRTTGSKKTLREISAGFGRALVSSAGTSAVAALAALAVGAGSGAGRERAPQASMTLAIIATNGTVTALTREEAMLDIRNDTVSQAHVAGKPFWSQRRRRGTNPSRRAPCSPDANVTVVRLRAATAEPGPFRLAAAGSRRCQGGRRALRQTGWPRRSRDLVNVRKRECADGPLYIGKP